jgi:hypothetical protein
VLVPDGIWQVWRAPLQVARKAWTTLARATRRLPAGVAAVLEVIHGWAVIELAVVVPDAYSPPLVRPNDAHLTRLC